MPQSIPQFDAQFQKHFCAYLLRDSQLLMQCHKYLQPDHFSNEVMKTLVLVVKQYYETYRSAPDEMIFAYLKELHAKGKITDPFMEILQGLIREMFSEPLQNRAHLLEIYDVALKHLAFDAVMPKFVDFARQGDFAEAQQAMRRALQGTPQGRWDEGSWYGCNPDDRNERRRIGEADALPTLIKPMDQRGMYIHRGEIGILQGQRTSIGKSAFITQLARNYCFQGMRSIIYTLEMSQSQYEDRLDMCVSGLTYEGLEDKATLRQRLGRIINDKALLIKQFPTGKTTVEDLIEHTQQLRDNHQFHPDVIFVDYDDLLEPATREAKGNLYQKGLEIYRDLRGWMQDEHMGMWIASQSKSGASEKVTVKEDDLGTSRAKGEVADVVITINRTPEEQLKGLTRLYFAKKRVGKAQFEITIPTDMDRMQFYDQSREFKEAV